MTENIIICPHCGYNKAHQYVPGEDDGQEAYWRKWQCDKCRRTWDK